MKEVPNAQDRVFNAEELLRGKPPPRYLVGEVVIDEDGLGLEATALFPSEDKSIGDRGHVNTANYLFAMWSAAHILADINGLKETRAISGDWSVSKELKPGQPVRLIAKVENGERHQYTARGVLKAQFLSIDGVSLGKFSSNFIAKVKR